jgi:hypothetical protein
MPNSRSNLVVKESPAAQSDREADILDCAVALLLVTLDAEEDVSR